MTRVAIEEMDGIFLVQPFSSSDMRGEFIKIAFDINLYEKPDSVAFSVNPTIRTIRGSHVQLDPFIEKKLVTCVQGEIYDVLVDIRPSSRTFGK
jgi:dTDP-4-dehydrorhamnose 3,5-epimerase